jgi:drug/metabolite transporter (DMT)-like permease
VNAIVAVFAVLGLVLTTVAAFAFNWALVKEARQQIRTGRARPRDARRGGAMRVTIAAGFAAVGLGLIVVEPFGEQHTAEFVIGGCGLLLLIGVNVSVGWVLWHNRRRK